MSGISGSLQIKSIDDVSRVAQMMSKSGFFDNAKSAAQAGVKILAGMELGIPPVASVRGVYILDGNTCLSSGLLAALIKQHPRYDYKVVEATDERAELQFFEEGEEQGTVSFSMDEAHSIDHGNKKLAEKDNWQNYPSDMCFSRALSRGRRRYCPDIGNGLYTPDEMVAVTDKEGHVVEAEVVEETSNASSNGEPDPNDDLGIGEPTDPEDAADKEPNDFDELPFDSPDDPPINMTRRFHAIGTELYDDWDAKRPELVEAITDGRTDSALGLTATEMQNLIDGMEEKMGKQADQMISG